MNDRTALGDDEDSLARAGLTANRRLSLLERDVLSQARALGEMVKVVSGHGSDIKALQDWHTMRLIAEAREEERDKSLYARLDRIDAAQKATNDDLAAMRGVFTRLLWYVAPVIIVAAMGGLALVLVYGVNALAPGATP